jgi:hypothetical protein
VETFFPGINEEVIRRINEEVMIAGHLGQTENKFLKLGEDNWRKSKVHVSHLPVFHEKH